MENPIVDNRIVSDNTYAVRNFRFLMNLYNDAGSYAPWDEEEYEYLLWTACKLIMYQYDTCPDSEKWYFENLVKGSTSAKDFIKKLVDADEYRYLKVIHAI